MRYSYKKRFSKNKRFHYTRLSGGMLRAHDGPYPPVKIGNEEIFHPGEFKFIPPPPPRGFRAGKKIESCLRQGERIP